MKQRTQPQAISLSVIKIGLLALLVLLPRAPGRARRTQHDTYSVPCRTWRQPVDKPLPADNVFISVLLNGMKVSAPSSLWMLTKALRRYRAAHPGPVLPSQQAQQTSAYGSATTW